MNKKRLGLTIGLCIVGLSLATTAFGFAPAADSAREAAVTVKDAVQQVHPAASNGDASGLLAADASGNQAGATTPEGTEAAGNGSSAAVQTEGWQQSGSDISYLKAGRALTGWQKLDGKWYKFDSDGKLLKGWIYYQGRYCFGARTGQLGAIGALQMGFQDVDGHRYYFNPAAGGLNEVGWSFLDGHWHKFTSDGQLQTGLIPYGASWCYGDPDANGALVEDAWRQVGDKSYFFQKNGGVAANGWLYAGGSWYKFTSPGNLQLGWIKWGDGWSYAKREGGLGEKGALVTGATRIAGTDYLFDANGITREGWYKDGQGWHYASYSGGVARTTWKKIAGKWYYFDQNSTMLTGKQSIGGASYYLDPVNGDMKTGWIRVASGKVLYASSNGDLAFGKRTIDGKNYFFGDGGWVQKVGYQNPVAYYRVEPYAVKLNPKAYWPYNYVTPSRIDSYATKQQCIDVFTARAQEYLGTPYKWNWSSMPGVGVDCIGLVYQCAYACGMDLGEFNPWDHYITGPNGWHSHDANNFWNYGKTKHVPVSQRTRGDILYWPGHVAIYMGDDWMIEAYPGYVRWSRINHPKLGWPKGCMRLFN